MVLGRPGGDGFRTLPAWQEDDLKCAGRQEQSGAYQTESGRSHAGPAYDRKNVRRAPDTISPQQVHTSVKGLSSISLLHADFGCRWVSQ